MGSRDSSRRFLRFPKTVLKMNGTIHALLKQLVDDGLHGSSVEEAALTLIQEGLRSRIRDGSLEPVKPRRKR